MATNFEMKKTVNLHQNDGRGDLIVERWFTTPGIHPFDEIEWERRDARIIGARGEVVFEQKDVEVPKFWSQNATNIVASKYFRGPLGTPQRESSVKQLIGRVVKTITSWGLRDGYFASEEEAETFAAELTHLLVHQKAAFNSPVYFNIGVPGERPQGSACFILSIEDTMESILDWYRTEGLIFKGGSGSGVNLSKLRSSKERLSSGGMASGPVSFMRGADAIAGTIKSGGKTRRAAKMVVLNVDHPDIEEFIWCKAKEERKAYALAEAGYDLSLDGEAWVSIQYQNANNSVRVTDDFMRAVLEDQEWHLKAVTTGEILKTVKARDLMRQIAQAAWECADPGIQYDTTINDWHTCPNSGRINASNPCSEYMHLDDSACLGPEVRISTKQGLLPVAELYRRQQGGEIIFVKTELLSEHSAVPRHGKRGYRPADVYARQVAFRPAVVIKTGRKKLFRIELSTGQSIRLTADHKVLTETGWKEVRDLVVGKDAIVTQKQSTPLDDSEVTKEETEFYHLLGWMIGDGYCTNQGQKPAFGLVFGSEDREVAEYLLPIFRRFVKPLSMVPEKEINISTQENGILQIGSTTLRAFQTLVERYGVHPATPPEKRVPKCVFEAPKALQAAFLGALFSADGRVFTSKPGRRTTARIIIRLASNCPQLLSDVQLLLFDFGIRSSVNWTHPKGRKDPQGTLSIYGHHAYKFFHMIGFPLSERKQALARKVCDGRPYKGSNYTGRGAVVRSIQETGEDEVYDISEPVTHSMIAEGMIIHNCNLASLNLMKFLDEQGEFDVESFKHAVATTVLAQEIIVGNASYPTEKIRQNSIAFRQLGLGYANLGALLMARGLPYDSDEGRALAGAITALMTGHAYATSALIAKKMGPFAGFEENREPMLRVMRKHRDALGRIDAKLVPSDLYEAAKQAWDDVIRLGELYGYRNAQASVLAPTGTISFMMDCDTTGIEPDLALVKYKTLVGGGMMRIVNQTVPLALKRLGYSPDEIRAIVGYVDEKGTIEGAPHLKPEHLPVFDCALRPVGGTRSIHYMGHVRMLAAVQPFISGAISKTINVPRDVTVDEVMDIYIQGWRLGLKALAIYRDSSKKVQPLSAVKEEREQKEPRPIRKRLPDERQAITHKFSVGGQEGYITVGLFDDGTPGEVFLTIAKEGSTVSGLMDVIATETSIALQYGVPLKDLIRKFINTRFEPAGITNNPQIRFATSIIDYVFRWLGLKFLPYEDQVELGLVAKGALEAQEVSAPASAEAKLEGDGRVAAPQLDGPPCFECGAIMVRAGSCHACLNCGATRGCS